MPTTANLSIPHPVRAVAEADYNPELARVNFTAVWALPKELNAKPMGETLNVLRPLGSDVQVFVPYLIVMNSLNYRFWEQDADGALQRYRSGNLVGALAMQFAFEEAYLAQVSPGGELDAYEGYRALGRLAERVRAHGVSFIFGDIPDAESRRDILLEVLDVKKLGVVARYLQDRLMVDNHLDWSDACVLAARFPLAYGDRYLKKAQLTLMFLAAQCNAVRGDDAPPCVVEASVCADYQLPKVLRAMGLLTYGAELAELVDGERPIPLDSNFERAIRAATVIACDSLAEHFDADISAVDFWLWLQRNQAKDAKFHLTATTAY